MRSHFTIQYKKVKIKVEGNEQQSFVLKYPDSKFIVLDRGEKEWAVEDRSGDFWSDEDIQNLGALINKNDPDLKNPKKDAS